MISIVISIRPEWACKILNGEKKIEVRKGLALYNALKKAEEKGEEVEFLMYVTKDKPLIRLESLLGRKIKYDVDLKRNRNAYSKTFEGKVVARFKAKAEVIKIELTRDPDDDPECDYYTVNFVTKNLSQNKLLKESCLGYLDLRRYIHTSREWDGNSVGTALHIEDLEIFDKPKELSEFFHGFKLKNNGAIMFDRDSKALRQRTPYGYEYVYPLSHAPRSWCYAEEA